MPSNHTIHRQHHHFGWDNANAPVLVVAPGDTVEFETVDSSGAQLSPTSTLADLAALDFGKVNPVTGPVCVDGAEPGRRAEGHASCRSQPSGWGWTANIPGFGLLADQFPEPALHIWKYDPIDLARPSTARRARAAQAVRRHDRPGAGRARPAQHRPAAPLRRQHGHPRPRRRHRTLPAGGGRRARCSRSATPMRRRATARSAARRSRARCRWRCASTWSRARTCRRRASPRPGR